MSGAEVAELQGEFPTFPPTFSTSLGGSKYFLSAQFPVQSIAGHADKHTPPDLSVEHCPISISFPYSQLGRLRSRRMPFWPGENVLPWL